MAYYSNWAGAFANAPAAYYEWMYYDGYESGNVDCERPTDPGCWGHRHNILFQDGGETGEYEAAMGAATGTDSRSGETGYAMLTLASWPRFDPPLTYYYTWAEAQADGAGTHPYDPGVPDLSPPESNLASPHLELRWRGRTLRIGGDEVLLGRRVTVAIRREVVPCALHLGASRCGWVKRGPVRHRELSLARRTVIRLRPASAWERVAIHARVPGFESDGKRYTTASASLLLLGPKPHDAAR
jgi:hypothetical protein